MIPRDTEQRRARVTLVTLLVVPPLAPLVWALLSGPLRSTYLASRLFRAGALAMVLSALPLMAVIVGDAAGLTANPPSNPIGLGLLVLAGTVVGSVLMTAGDVFSWLAAERNRR